MTGGGVECRWGRQKSRLSTNIWLSDRWLLQCEQQLRRWAVQFILEHLIVTLIRFVLLALLFNFVMHCIISTVAVAFEISYLILSYLLFSYLILEENRTEFNCTQPYISSATCARRLRSTIEPTGRHEASRGLSATARPT